MAGIAAGVDPLADFDTHTVPYKTVSGHDILADISLPKGIKAGKHPIVVNWHGGALVTGSRNFKLFYPPWLPPFADQNSAIIISPDYRLLPEAQAADIVEDLESFWAWLKTDFPRLLHDLFAGAHEADLDRIIVNGGSAGGWCAVHLGLSHPGEIRALLVQYPGVGVVDKVDEVDPDDPKNGEKKVLGQKVWGKDQLEERLKAIKPGDVVTEGGFDRMILSFSALAWGLLPQWWGHGDVRPIERVREGAHLPPKIWLIHGKDDSVVPIASSKLFVPKVQQFCPTTEVRVEYFDGEHGFDMHLDPKELQPGLEWVQKAWVV